jgi:hypothetical protein
VVCNHNETTSRENRDDTGKKRTSTRENKEFSKHGIGEPHDMPKDKRKRVNCTDDISPRPYSSASLAEPPPPGNKK